MKGREKELISWDQKALEYNTKYFKFLILPFFFFAITYNCYFASQRKIHLFKMSGWGEREKKMAE